MKKRVMLGQNPIVVQAALNIVNKLYDKLTDLEKIQFLQLNKIENKEEYFKNFEKLGDLLESRKD